MTDQRKKIVFFGDSLTDGYQLLRTEAYPHHIQQKIDELSLPYTCINAGLSGEASTEGLKRLPSVLGTHLPDIFVLELGANDGLRGLSFDVLKQNLIEMIGLAKQANANAKILLTGMELPILIDEKIRTAFRSVFQSVAEVHADAFMPFVLQDVATVPHLSLADGLHPNAEGHKIMAENIWKHLQPLLD